MKSPISTCIAVVVLLLSACGSETTSEVASTEAKKSALFAPFSTVPGHNTAVESNIYSCQGWSYRLLLSLEQHQDGGSPTGWYAAVGPSSPAVTGTSSPLVNGSVTDVSADVYLNCFNGFLPATSGTFSDGRAFSGRLYYQAPGYGVICQLTTVWPASWHAPNQVLWAYVRQYDWAPQDETNFYGGTVYMDIHVDGLPAPGNGWCGDGWYGGGIAGVSKLPLPPPPPRIYACTGDNYTDYVLHRGCVVPPPMNCSDYGAGPCPPPPNLQ